jgi:O-antigen/teichoic acid export membrane protein
VRRGEVRRPDLPPLRHLVSRIRPSGVVGGGGMALLVATVLSNAGNLVFAVLMSRLLGADIYGAFGSIQGIVTVVTVLTMAVQLAVAQTVAGKLRQHTGPLRLHRPVLVAGAAGLGSLLVTAALSPLIEDYLHLSSIGPVLLFGLVLAPTLAATAPTGVLLGRQRYGLVGVSLVSSSFLRIIVGAALVEAGLGLDGALWATAAGQVLLYLVVLWPLRHEIRDTADSVYVPFHLGPAALSLAALSGLSACIAVDSVFARHFLPAAEAGHYVAAATAARIALFAPMAVALIVFPRFAALNAGDPGERRLLGEALAVTALLSVGAAIVLMAVPHLVVDLMFGPRYREAAPLLRILALVGAALGILGLLVYYYLARSSVVAGCSWLGVVAAAGIIVVGLHASGTEIAWVMVGSTATVLTLALVASPLLPTARRLRLMATSRSAA